MPIYSIKWNLNHIYDNTYRVVSESKVSKYGRKRSWVFPGLPWKWDKQFLFKSEENPGNRFLWMCTLISSSVVLGVLTFSLKIGRFSKCLGTCLLGAREKHDKNPGALIALFRAKI